jgi:NAD(P)H-hydrate epimerase
MNRHFLLTSAEMRAAEGRVIALGTPGLTLMERAGAATARAAERLVSEGGRVLVLCGPGNNGGDGYVVARDLAASGFEVAVAALATPRAGTDAARAAATWTGPVLSAASGDPAQADLFVDALFGTGLARDLDGAAADLVARVNAAGKPVLAVDIPSGIDADTGAVRGAAIRADATVTFAARKPGHLLYPGRALCGLVEVADIGIPAELVAASGSGLATNDPALWSSALPRLRPDGHKYDRGHALVLSGGPGHTGAARLAARGALRAGAGLVSVVTPSEALAMNAARLTAIMLRVCDKAEDLAELLTDQRFNAIALGPALGVSAATRDWVRTALAADRGTVLDADALTSFAGEPHALAALVGAGRACPVVITPHEGEFARLFSGDDPGLATIGQGSKLERARAASRFMRAVTILKGADTVIAAPDGRAAINANGSPYLGTAGSGDVLGGIVAGLLAQGMPGFEAACAAVWMHAEAGGRFGPGLIAEDIPELLPGVLRELFG